MARNTIQSENWNFTVKQEPIYHNGIATGFFGNFREDNGVCLGVTSARYSVTQNAELVDAVQTALSKMGMEPYSVKSVVNGKGEQFFSTIDLRDGREVVKGDYCGLRLTIQNSFDRSLSRAAKLGLLRGLCGNGMVTMETDFSFESKHHDVLDMTAVETAINAALGNADNAFEIFRILQGIRIETIQGQYLLKRMQTKGILSDKLRGMIQGIWLAPAYKEDEERNLYNLLNAATQHLQAVEQERFVYARAVGGKVLSTLDKLAKDAGTLSQWIAPIELEA